MADIDIMLEAEIGSTEARLNTRYKKVIRQARSIAQHLEAIANQLESKDPRSEDYLGLNDLGELQAQGPGFDVAIADLCALHQQYLALMRIKQNIEANESK